MHHGFFVGPKWLGILVFLLALLVQPTYAARPLESAGFESPGGNDAGNTAAEELHQDPHEKLKTSNQEDSQEKLSQPNRETSDEASKAQRETSKMQHSEEPQDACISIFKDPKTWQVFPRVGRTMPWAATPSVLSDGTANATESIAASFRNFPAVIQKVEDDSFTNVFLRPGIDVILHPSLAQQCTWTGELSLSTKEDCSKEVDDHEDQLVTSYTKGGVHVFRLALRKQYLVAQFKTGDLESSSLEAKDIQYFLCMKPAGQRFKPEPLHFFWYKRDADGKSAKAIFSTPFKDMMSNWIFKDSIVMDKPLYKELHFEECAKKRWAAFDDAHNKKITDKQMMEEIRIDAALRALRDDCSAMLPKPPKMAPHSAMLLCFQIRRSSEGATTPDDDENVAATFRLPGLVASLLSIMALPLS